MQMAGRALKHREWVEGIKNGELLGLRCNDCGEIMATPKRLCLGGHKGNLSLFKFSGRGKIRSYTIIRVPPPKFDREAPYAIADIELDEGSGLTARLVDTNLDKLAIGQPVEMDCVGWGAGDFELVFRTVGNGTRPVPGSGRLGPG